MVGTMKMIKLWQILGSLEQVGEAAGRGTSEGRGDTAYAVVLRQSASALTG